MIVIERNHTLDRLIVRFSASSRGAALDNALKKKKKVGMTGLNGGLEGKIEGGYRRARRETIRLPYIGYDPFVSAS